MTTLLLAFSVIVTTVGLYPYVRATARGIVRPRLVTWGVWLVLAAVMTISALLEGHLASAILSVQCLVGCLIVVTFGWRSGSREIHKLDIMCLIGASLGIAALVVLHNPTIALLIAITVDGIAFIPTLYHAWKRPYEEGMACYVCNVGAASLACLAALLANTSFMGAIYPLYSISFNSVMVLLILAGRPLLLEDEPAYLHVDGAIEAKPLE